MDVNALQTHSTKLDIDPEDYTVARAGDQGDGVLQANYSELTPVPTRDLVLCSATLGDTNSGLALGFRVGGQLVATPPTSAILKIVEFVGDKPLALGSGTVVAQSDAEGVRYRTLLDLSSKRLRSLVEGRMKAQTALLDVKAQISLVIPATPSGAAVSGASAPWDMVHNQSVTRDIAIDLSNQTVGTTVSYDVQVQLNAPASDYHYRQAQISASLDVTRAAGGAFTSVAVVGASTASGEVFPEVAGDQRLLSDYRHDLSLSAVPNGSTGVTLQCTVDTEDYTRVRKITVPWSSGVTLDSTGRLSADQDLDVWYDSNDSGRSTHLSGGHRPWESLLTFKNNFADASGAFYSWQVSFALFGRESGMDLVLRPVNLATDYRSEFDKFAIKVQQSPGSNYAATPHHGGTYPGCSLTAVVSEPPASGYAGLEIRRATQPFRIRLFRGLD